jgi:hypothetical protein
VKQDPTGSYPVLVARTNKRGNWTFAISLLCCLKAICNEELPGSPGHLRNRPDVVEAAKEKQIQKKRLPHSLSLCSLRRLIFFSRRFITVTIDTTVTQVQPKGCKAAQEVRLGLAFVFVIVVAA